jgi:orotidine-5'-phosphate decarboxylase
VTGIAQSFDAIRESVGPLCVGIDPSSEALAMWGLDDTADGATEFARAILDAARGRVGIVKPQVGYFERFGAAGFNALETIIAEARLNGLAVIADAKRGDIGTTMSGYAAAWLGHGPLGSDALTVSPYLGFDALEPAFDAAANIGGTAFVLCATSNPDAPTVQLATSNGRSLAATIASLTRTRNAGERTVGLVVGATRSLDASGLTDADLEGTLILAPGFGAQGATLADVRTIFGRATDMVIPSVSRSVVRGGPSAVAAAIDAHLAEAGR